MAVRNKRRQIVVAVAVTAVVVAATVAVITLADVVDQLTPRFPNEIMSQC